MTDFSAFQANYQPLDTRSKYAPPAPNGFTQFLANAAPLVGGTLGAIGGSFLAPGVGTAGGGAAGAGIGEAIKQKLLGQDFNVGDIAQEAAFGALPGAGRLLKGAVGGAKALSAGEKFTQGFKDANAAKEVAGIATPSTLTQKVNQGARNLDMKQSGLGVGQTYRGKPLTPGAANDLYDFGRSNGIKAGTPVSQAAQAEDLLKATTTKLDNALTKIDRPLVSTEADSIANDVRNRIAENASITRGTATADKLLQKVGKARSLRELEQVRREADALAFTASGAKKTAQAAQANEVRDAIDNFITPLSEEYKAAKGDYAKAKGLLELTSKGADKARGLNIFGVQVGQQEIPGTASKAADVVQRLTGGKGKPEASALATAFRPSQLLRKGIAQATSQGIGSALTAPAVDPNAQPPINTSTDTSIPIDTGQTMPDQSNDPFSEQGIKQAIANDINKTGGKNTATLLSLYNAFGKTPAPIKKTETQRARDEAAQLTQSALDQLNTGKVQTGPIAAPLENFKSIFNAGDQPTLNFNVTVDSLKAAIAKARAGTSFTPNEEALLNKYAPTSGDSQQQLQTKLSNLMQVYRQAAVREYGTQYTDPTDPTLALATQ